MVRKFKNLRSVLGAYKKRVTSLRGKRLGYHSKVGGANRTAMRSNRRGSGFGRSRGGLGTYRTRVKRFTKRFSRGRGSRGSKGLSSKYRTTGFGTDRIKDIVTQIMQPPLKNARDVPYIASCNGNQCVFLSSTILENVDITSMFTDCVANSLDYNKVANRTTATGGMIKFPVICDKAQADFLCSNACTADLFYTVWEITLKHDLPLNGTIGNVDSPVARLQQYGQLGDLASTTQSGGGWTYNDYRFTPFMCPMVTKHYNIKTLVSGKKLRAGESFTYSCSRFNTKLIDGIDNTLNETDLYGRKGKYKSLLFKVWGVDIANLVGSTKTAITAPVAVVGHTRYEYKFHQGPFTTEVYNEDVSNPATSGTNTQINRVSGVVENYATL